MMSLSLKEKYTMFILPLIHLLNLFLEGLDLRFF